MSSSLRLALATPEEVIEPGSSREVLEPAPVRVILADDHASARGDLRALLEPEDHVEVVAEATDVAGLLRQMEAQPADVIVLDLQLVRRSRIDVIRRLRQATSARLIMLTVERSGPLAHRLLHGGASAVVLKDRIESDLGAAVQSVARGEQFVSPILSGSLASVRRNLEADELTPRETEVLRLIALGYTSAEIARLLQVSRRTIDSHRANIHRKLGLTTRAELVHFALGRRLIGN